MPTATFFNLPPAKRQRLMDSAWQEFTTASYLDASINRIIQTAEISRGSFYQYFSGKQDLFAYLLQTVLRTAEEMFAAQLTAHSNDLFAAMMGMYDTLLWQKTRHPEDAKGDMLRRLVQLNIDLDHSVFAELLDLDTMAAEADALLRSSGYPLETPQECAAVIHMLLSLGLCALNSSLRDPRREPCNRRMLETQLNIIRSGIRSKETELC